jgi:hypothetical protein
MKSTRLIAKTLGETRLLLKGAGLNGILRSPLL